jgi:hypothetical protein
MSNYIISARNINADGSFGNEPSDGNYLIIPDGVLTSNKTNIVDVNTFLKPFISNPNLGDVLVYIHGFDMTVSDVIKRHNELKNGLAKQGYKGELITFDWPSSDSPLLYLRDRHDVMNVAFELVTKGVVLLAKQQGTGCVLNVHALAHSTGAFVIREAFDDARTTQDAAEINWTLSQLLFIAGDVSSNSLSDAPHIYGHCNRFTNYFNPYDKILAISNAKRAGFENRVGRVGLPIGVPSNAVDVNCGDYYNANIDKLKVVFGAPSHSWYFYSDEWYKDAYQTIMGEIDRNVIDTRIKDINDELYLKV